MWQATATIHFTAAKLPVTRIAWRVRGFPLRAMFQVAHTEEHARTGTLSTMHGDVATPAALLYTRRGGVLNLTPDMLQRLLPEGNGVIVNALHYTSHPDPAMMREMGGDIHSFAGLLEQVVVAGVRDPLLWEFGAKGTNDQHLAVSLSTGNAKVSTATLADVVAALQPDVWVTLCDEVAVEAKPNRVHKSVDRTLQWLDECLALRQERQLEGQVWAAVAGGADVDQRTRSAADAAKRKVDGFWLCSYGVGEGLKERHMSMAAALRQLPDDKPRALTGAVTPHEVLQAVALGIDVLDATYPVLVTQAGQALTFCIPEATPAAGSGGEAIGSGSVTDPGACSSSNGMDACVHPEATADCGEDGHKINLWDARYTEDKRPLLPGCSCLVCKGYTRSYVHHLLETHEMLAGVLLEMHNSHHWLQFFAAMRAAIAQGRFVQFRRDLKV